ncbi:amidohydrolase [Subtercola lobariae]|uniref:Amidohydrolase n=1 Tax=Subtercola lobariae TaxID=1588641 RepID=A0A917EX67_9MICO|nr:amidohydrolase [Subtercola lobariae]
MPSQLYRNARIFSAGVKPHADAMLVEQGRIAYIGDESSARRIASFDVEVIDLEESTVLPGFVDGHAHVVGTGEAAGQVNLWGADDVAEIQRRIKQWGDQNPDAPRIIAQGWNHASIPDGMPTRQMLDVVSDRPIYATAYDFHSIWLNSAALIDAEIGDETVSPAGGSVHRDSDGHPTGYIDETAMHRLVWPVLNALVDDEQRDLALATVLELYRQSGVTASTDMALTEEDLAAFVRAEDLGTLTSRIAAFWRIQWSDDPAEALRQVGDVARMALRHNSPFLRVVGIKIMVDGTVDGCTAALGHPYSDGTNANPIWSIEDLAPVVAAADAAGLQVAMHAIGDEAIRVAIGSIEYAVSVNGARSRRHRIEHLEVVGPDEIERLAALGITASMQPVHADPAIQENWRARLGDARINRGFPWPEMTQAGARLVFGTDSPTSPHSPLPNMFVAATRRSALDPSLPANIAAFALPLEEAIVHATRDAAWACQGESSYGSLAAGLWADFIVLDRDIFGRPIDELLDARVIRTVVGGRTVHKVQGAEADRD